MLRFSSYSPSLNPIYRFGSEYSAGRMGWLMKLAFFVWGGALLALALAMARGLAGLGQRVFLAFMFAWQVLTARGLATGAFALRQQHTDPD
jgi:hypothetical protein